MVHPPLKNVALWVTLLGSVAPLPLPGCANSASPSVEEEQPEATGGTGGGPVGSIGGSDGSGGSGGTCVPQVLGASSCEVEERTILGWLDVPREALADPAFPLGDPRYVCRVDDRGVQAELESTFGSWTTHFSFAEGCGSRYLSLGFPYPPEVDLAWGASTGDVVWCWYGDDVPNAKQCGAMSWSAGDFPDCDSWDSYICFYPDPLDGTGGTGGGSAGSTGGAGGAGAAGGAE